MKFGIPVFLLLVSFAQAEVSLLPPDLETIRQQGFRSLYNMRYEDAESAFREMVRVHPEHPAGYIYEAKTIWLEHLATLRRLQTSLYNKGDSFFFESSEETDKKVEAKFLGFMTKGITLAQNLVDKNPKDRAGLYYLGVAKNIVAGFDTTVKRRFIYALRNASKGIDLHRKLIELYPDFIDARLSVGIYNYVIGSLPLAVKILVFFGGIRGSRDEGLKMVEQVAAEGNYSKVDAAAMLLLLYNREKRFQENLRIAQKLSSEFPENSLFKLEEAQTLAQIGRFQDSFKAFEALLQHPAAMAYMPDLVHYKYAEALSEAGKWQEALSHYQQAAQTPKAPTGLITLAHLRAGQCLDVLGKRQEAVEQYRLVLNRKESYDSREVAKKNLKKPFQPD